MRLSVYRQDMYGRVDIEYFFHNQDNIDFRLEIVSDCNSDSEFVVYKQLGLMQRLRCLRRLGIMS
jgi:hypothetical protein